MQQAKIFIIVPVYNENEVLRTTVVPLLEAGYRVVVVDDGSKCNQSRFLENLPVFFLRHKTNLGQGAALQTGTDFSLQHGADILVHFDADGQHRETDIALLTAPLIQNKADIVFGSRFMNSENKEIPLLKKITLKAGRYVNLLFTRILLSDAHNGLRALNRKAAEQIVIKENRMAHATEILMQVKKNKLRYTEVPVHVRYSAYAKNKGQKSWHSIRIFYDLVLHKFFE